MLGLYLAVFFAAISISISQIFYILTIAMILYARKKEIFHLRFSFWPFLPFILSLFLVFALTSMLGNDPKRSFYALKGVFWIFNFYLGYFLIVYSNDCPKLISFNIKSSPKDRFINLLLAVSLGGALSVGWGVLNMLRFDYTSIHQLGASVRYGNMMALITLLTACAIILSLYRNRKEFAVFSISGVICFTGLMLSTTRGAILALMASIFLLFIHRYKLKGMLFFAAAVIVFFMSIWITINLSPQMYHKALGMSDLLNPRSSTGWRFILWKESFRVFCENPVFGVGMANLSSYLKALPNQYQSSAHAHNNFLQILAEHGIAGFLAVSALMLRLFAFHAEAAFKGSVYGIMGTLLIVILTLEGFTEYNFFFSAQLYMLFWTLNGVLVRLEEIRLQQRTSVYS